jgi:hypothetical protein
MQEILLIQNLNIYRKHTFIRVIPNQTNILAEKKTLQILKNIETESFKLPIRQKT